MTLQVQEFLRNGGTIQDLEDKYAIRHKRHPHHPNLVLFKYNQIESDFSQPIVCECRGLILDESDNWRVISRAFSKFFNHGEGHAAQIDWSTARVQEKVDGSLCTLYFYQSWYVATTGTPDASGEMHLSGKTFAEMFFKLLNQHLVDKNAYWHEPMFNHCYYFELTSQYNRVVVQHKEPSLTLLGARNIVTDQEISPERAVSKFDSRRQIKVVKDFPLSSFDDILATFGSMDPLIQEGYVIVDANFNRVKVKHPGYVALHHAKVGMGTKAFVEIIRIGEMPEFLTAFPEFESEFLKVQVRYLILMSHIMEDYIRLQHIESQKEFALEAIKTRCSSALFSLRAKKVSSIKQFLQEMHIDRVMDMLGY